MANVYLAERQTDFRQKVALKLIKRGMDSDEIVRRFRQERQILADLADLHHPSIARLLDGGTTSDGLPYFAMELIDLSSCRGPICRRRTRRAKLLSGRTIDGGALRRPVHLQFAVGSDTVAQIEIDDDLIRDACLFGYSLKVIDNVIADTKCDLLLEPLRIGIRPRFHRCQIVFLLHLHLL